MKHWLLGTTALCLVSFGAAAADLPARVAAPAPVYAMPVFTWTGFYVGASAGGLSLRTNVTSVSGPFGCFWTCGSSVTSSGYGAIGGLQAGYNHQIGSLVVGFEADISATTAKTNAAIVAINYVQQSKLEAIGTARLRLGYAMDRAMLYATGGLAYGKVSFSAGAPNFTFPNISDNGWRTGYAIGAGLQYAIDARWSVRAEALYYDLGKKTYVNANGYAYRAKHDGIIARVGLDYRFGAPAAAVVAKY